MMNNDFRDDKKSFKTDPNNPYNTPNAGRPQYDQLGRKKSSSALWLSLAAVAFIALGVYFTLDSSQMAEQNADQPYAARTSESGMAQPSDIEPAEGNTTSGSVTDTTSSTSTVTTPSADTPSAAPVETTSPVEPGMASPHVYASEDECTSAVNKPCHYVTCDSVPEGKQPDAACGANFQKGWQPVVPAVDTTNVPEEVAPPLTGQQDSPTTPPVLTGQDPADQMTAPPRSGATSP